MLCSSIHASWCIPCRYQQQVRKAFATVPGCMLPFTVAMQMGGGGIFFYENTASHDLCHMRTSHESWLKVCLLASTSWSQPFQIDILTLRKFVIMSLWFFFCSWLGLQQTFLGISPSLEFTGCRLLRTRRTGLSHSDSHAALVVVSRWTASLPQLHEQSKCAL